MGQTNWNFLWSCWFPNLVQKISDETSLFFILLIRRSALRTVVVRGCTMISEGQYRFRDKPLTFSRLGRSAWITHHGDSPPFGFRRGQGLSMMMYCALEVMVTRPLPYISFIRETKFCESLSLEAALQVHCSVWALLVLHRGISDSAVFQQNYITRLKLNSKPLFCS